MPPLPGLATPSGKPTRYVGQFGSPARVPVLRPSMMPSVPALTCALMSTVSALKSIRLVGALSVSGASTRTCVPVCRTPTVALLMGALTCTSVPNNWNSPTVMRENSSLVMLSRVGSSLPRSMPRVAVNGCSTSNPDGAKGPSICRLSVVMRR